MRERAECWWLFIFFQERMLRHKNRFLFFFFGCTAHMWDLSPWPGIRPPPLHWKSGVLTAGPLGKAQELFSITIISFRKRNFTATYNHRIIHLIFFHWNIYSIVLISAAAAAAKSLQSCPTLCDPMDRSLPGSSVHGIFQARVLEWGAIAFSSVNF